MEKVAAVFPDSTAVSHKVLLKAVIKLRGQ